MSKKVTATSYRNRKGEFRVSLQFNRADALQLASGTPAGYQLLEEVRLAVKDLIEKEEQVPVGG